MKTSQYGLAALVVGTAAVLGTQVLSYGLVYPAANAHSRMPLWLALASGCSFGLLALLFALAAWRRANDKPQRFVALVGIAITGFFLFVIVFGFGIPTLVLNPQD